MSYESAPVAPKQRDVESIASLNSKPLRTSAPKMVMEHEDGGKPTASQVQSDSAQGKTFGEMAKRHGRTTPRGASGESSLADNADPDDVMRRTGGGNMELTFTPSASKSAEEKEAKRTKIKAKKAKADEFGYGLEKGSSQPEEEKFEGEDGSGRKRRRHVGRSASNTALRKMGSGSQAMRRK